MRFEASSVSVAMPAGKRQADFECPVILGIRPEELKAVARDEASLTGVIDVVEPTGPETMVTVQVGEQSISPACRRDSQAGEKSEYSLPSIRRASTCSIPAASSASIFEASTPKGCATASWKWSHAAMGDADISAGGSAVVAMSSARQSPAWVPGTPRSLTLSM